MFNRRPIVRVRIMFNLYNKIQKLGNIGVVWWAHTNIASNVLQALHVVVAL